MAVVRGPATACAGCYLAAMHRLRLGLTVASLLLACGDDLPDHVLTGSSGAVGGTTTGGSSADTATSYPLPTTDAPTTTMDPTGASPNCGNGVVDDDEDCDDANLVEDDGCYTNCTLPFEVQWTETFDGGDIDRANDVLFDAEGNLYVLGITQVAGQGYDLWLRQYTPEGAEGWTWTYDGALHGNDFGTAMAWHESGDLLIVGSEQTENEDDVLVIRLATADQTPVWTRYYDGPGLGPDPIDDSDFANAVASDPAGNVYVAATVRVTDQEFDMWLRKYDADGTEIWTHEYDEPVVHGSDSPDAVLVNADGEIYLAGNSEVAQNNSDAWVRKLDVDGNEIWTEIIADVIITNGSLDPVGNLVLVGLENDNPSNINMWAAKFDPDFGSIGSTEFDGPSGQFDQALGVAVGGAGDVYLSGEITVVGEQSNIWVARFRQNLGQRWWSDSYGNADSKLADVGRAVAVSNDDMRVAVVGYESVIGQDHNAWVRMYRNSATPLAQ